MASNGFLSLKLEIWRQKNSKESGYFKNYRVEDISPESSFLEMLDILNDQLIRKNELPVAFDHDCREGICGSCSLYINGRAHGPDKLITTCQLHMRHFKNGDTIYIEPWRSKSFPVIKDLVVDRSAFDRIISAGGFISVNTSGNTIDGNALLISKKRVLSMVRKMDEEGFGNCSNTGACEVECPKGISLENIARMNREYFSASII